MTKPISQEKILIVVNGRNHKFVEFSHPDNPRAGGKGTITVICSKEHKFVTTVNSYLNARKDGCPICKRENLKVNNPNKKAPGEKVSVSTKLRRRTRPKIDPAFAHIKSKEELLAFLKANPNEYNNFMLVKLMGQQLNKDEGAEHHIIPKHRGGPDDDWNLIYLLPKDHNTAHELRYKVYKDPGDRDALRFWSKPHLNSIEAARKRAAMAHAVCREKKVGFFSSEQQSLNGKKGGAKKSEANIQKHISKISSDVKEALSQPMCWKHKGTGALVNIPANSIRLLVELRSLFAEALPESLGEERQKILNLETKNFTSAISKVIKGKRNTAHNFLLLRDCVTIE